MLVNRVFHAPPGALAEHYTSSRMNWKVKLYSHGSSLMFDSNTETAKWYPLRAANEIHATVSTTEDATRASTKHEKEMSGADN